MVNFDFQQKIAILGYGVNNEKLTEWLIKHGAVSISILDRNTKIKEQRLKSKDADKNSKINYQLGDNYLNNLDQFDIIFRTPGIPYLTPEIQIAKKKGVKIYSQTKLFFDLCPAMIIGVTGTKGKGTTAALIYKILTQNTKCQMLNSKIYLAGNFGKDPFEFLDELTKNDIVILELSSFQLQDLEKSPHIAVVLPITPDHLNHHKNMQEYINAKAKIIKFQKNNDFAMLCQDDKKSVDLAKKTPGQIVWFSGDGIDYSLYPSKLIGKHNLQNISAVIAVARILKIQENIIKEGIKNFQPLPHRLEFAAEINGVKYYDDSYATDADATIAALNAFGKSKNIILICGGSDKGVNYSELGKTIVQKCSFAIANGDTADRIISAIKTADKNYSSIYRTKDLKCSFAIAKSVSKPGDIILLSPASASFDQFNNASERGDKFKKIVNELK
ncbi:MAG: UDP-N-acetylmuramoylalanine--D-glutamate ligase [Candidatus Berkelbacteria bacterium Licking1014_85]|uniref:UDP-N-acetylmuramoylalanine--D-glutamate ligase n=1 Tax=Candidatus Berkelbacteria bacterium Licking1014_85 TaxID=2017148 RepID=A0A554LGX8_9BACT|nr:MAG: UDP-N-acetylmuramoylalanine--D-glutamate ligase [Candidatus Berkelbacteria bacterium Licking1014_85]